MEQAKAISLAIQDVATWQDGEITFPAYLWEQLHNALNPEIPIYDFTEPANVYSRHPHRDS